MHLYLHKEVVRHVLCVCINIRYFKLIGHPPWHFIPQHAGSLFVVSLAVWEPNIATQIPVGAGNLQYVYIPRSATYLNINCRIMHMYRCEIIETCLKSMSSWKLRRSMLNTGQESGNVNYSFWLLRSCQYGFWESIEKSADMYLHWPDIMFHHFYMTYCCPPLWL